MNTQYFYLFSLVFHLKLLKLISKTVFYLLNNVIQMNVFEHKHTHIYICMTLTMISKSQRNWPISSIFYIITNYIQLCTNCSSLLISASSSSGLILYIFPSLVFKLIPEDKVSLCEYGGG